MAAHQHFVSQHILEVSNVPVDTTGAAVVGDYYALREAKGIVWLIAQGAWAGGTPAVTLLQAQDVSGMGEKALAFTEYWTKVAIAGTVFSRQDVVNNTFNLPNVANTITVIEVAADQLDRSNAFGCVRINIASPGANADLMSVVALLYGLRHQGDPATILYDPKVD